MVDLTRLKKHFESTSATDLKYMSYSSEAVLQQTPGLSRLLLWLMALFLLIMIVWASLAEVDEYTRGYGRIVPSSDIQVIQNLEGGILAELRIAEGDLVSANQVLLQIDDTIFSSTFREGSLQAEQLNLKSVRLAAQANSTDFDQELKTYAGQFDDARIQAERALYEAQMREFRLRHDALIEKVAQKKQELSSIKVEKESLSNSYQLLKKELEFTRPLVAQGAVSHVELLRLERQVIDLKGQLERAALAIPQLDSSLQEAQNNADSILETFMSEARGELSETKAELARIQESNQALEDRVKRTVVRSPVRGTVKRLKVKTIGGVIKPGMDLVEIVPIDDSLLVDAKVLPRDIAFIHPEQQAMVKFTAYDYSIHGGLTAKVLSISPDTIVDEKEDRYYEIRLKTDSAHLGEETDPLPIIPGMTVQVDILTGKKTIMDYILKPIMKTKQMAFRER